MEKRCGSISFLHLGKIYPQRIVLWIHGREKSFQNPFVLTPVAFAAGVLLYQSNVRNTKMLRIYLGTSLFTQKIHINYVKNFISRKEKKIMRMKMAEKNVEVMNKINGAMYCITSVEDGKAYAQEILEKEPDQKLAEEKVVITEANAICFRFVCNPNSPVVPEGYYVENGFLMKSNEKVTEQGEIVICKILASFPGKLLLAVKAADTTPEKERDWVYLYTYEPKRDRFFKLLSFGMTMPAVYCIDNRVYCVYSEVYHKEYEENGVKVSKEFVSDAGVITIEFAADGTHTLSSYVSNVPFIPEVPHFTKDSILLSVGHEEIEDGSVQEINPYTLLLNVNDSNPEIINMYPITSVTENHFDRGLTLKSHKKTMIFNSSYGTLTFSNTEVLKELEGYDYLVDFKILREGRKSYGLVLSDINYNLKFVKVVETYDRGEIVTVHDYCCEF